jgi:hypothetical protein
VRDDKKAHKVQGIAIEKVRRNPKWLKDLMSDNRSLNLPIFLDSDVFDQVVRHPIEVEWEKPCRNLVEKVSELLAQAVEDFCQREQCCTNVSYPKGFSQIDCS